MEKVWLLLLYVVWLKNSLLLCESISLCNIFNEEIKMKKYKCESIRLCRFLYSLGFDKQSKYDSNGIEYWEFDWSNELQNSLSFFFSMRRKIKQVKQ